MNTSTYHCIYIFLSFFQNGNNGKGNRKTCNKEAELSSNITVTVENLHGKIKENI